MKSSVSICCSLNQLHDRGRSFLPHHMNLVGPCQMGLVGCNHCDRICILVLLKLQVLLPKNDILLSKVLHLLGISLLQGVHLSLQGDDDQWVIIKLLTRGTRFVCWVPLFRGSHGSHPWRGGFPFTWPSGRKESFPSAPWWTPNVLTELAESPNDDAPPWAPPRTVVTLMLKLVRQM